LQEKVKDLPKEQNSQASGLPDENKFRGTTANVFSRCRMYRLFAVFPFLWSRNPMLIGFGFLFAAKQRRGM